MLSLRTKLANYDLLLNGRIHERREHDLKFKQIAKGFISKGYLDPSDGNVYAHYPLSCIFAVFVSLVTVTVSL